VGGGGGGLGGGGGGGGGGGWGCCSSLSGAVGVTVGGQAWIVFVWEGGSFPDRTDYAIPSSTSLNTTKEPDKFKMAGVGRLYLILASRVVTLYPRAQGRSRNRRKLTGDDATSTHLGKAIFRLFSEGNLRGLR